MRKNLYELLAEMDLDIYTEYNTLVTLFRDEDCYYEYGNGYSAEDYIDEHYFRSFSFRGTFTSVKKMLLGLKLPQITRNLNDLLLLCEIIMAIYYEINLHTCTSQGFKKQMNTIAGNIKSILEKANYEIISLPNDKKKRIIVSKNPSTVLAAEVVRDISVATNLFEYNYYAVKGHLEEKQRILNAIAVYLEPSLKVKKLKDTPYKTLESELGFMFNKFHIRHNNKDGVNAQEYIVSLTNTQLEEWYDKIYTTAIVYILASENIAIHTELNELKKNYIWSN